MLSIRLLPVDEVAPLKTIRNAAFGLLFNPTIVARLKISGTEPNAVAGVNGDPKSVNEIPSRLYWNWLLLKPVLVPCVAKLTTIFEKPTVLTLKVRFRPLFALLVPPWTESDCPAASLCRALLVVPAANKILTALMLVLSVPLPWSTFRFESLKFQTASSSATT